MFQKKTRDNFKIIVAALLVIVAVASTAIVYSIQVAGLQNQINDLQSPKLINVNVGSSDDGHGVLHITGYVYNAGKVTAYGCHIDVNLTRSNGTTAFSTVYFGNDLQNPGFGGASVPGQTVEYIDTNVTYTGNSPINVTLTLGWIPPWQIPVP